MGLLEIEPFVVGADGGVKGNKAALLGEGDVAVVIAVNANRIGDEFQILGRGVLFPIGFADQQATAGSDEMTQLCDRVWVGDFAHAEGVGRADADGQVEGVWGRVEGVDVERVELALRCEAARGCGGFCGRDAAGVLVDAQAVSVVMGDDTQEEFAGAASGVEGAVARAQFEQADELVGLFAADGAVEEH